MVDVSTLKKRARKDFEAAGIDEENWLPYFVGYLAAIKRFAMQG